MIEDYSRNSIFIFLSFQSFLKIHVKKNPGKLKQYNSRIFVKLNLDFTQSVS